MLNMFSSGGLHAPVAAIWYRQLWVGLLEHDGLQGRWLDLLQQQTAKR